MKLTKVGHVFDRILDIGAILGAAIIVFSVLGVCVQVVMRYFMGEPLTWMIDVTALLLLDMTFLGAAWLLRKEGHVSMDMVMNRLNPRHQSLLNIITSIVSAIVLAVITWYGAKTTWIYFEMGYWMSTTLSTPKWLVLGIIPVGSFLLFIQFLRRTYGYLRSRTSSSTE
jgi:TRAP-type C4-dicarboxylate transport system permease small subunit